MICYRCGHNVPERALKCSNCGAELGSATRAMKIPRGSIKALRQRRAKNESGDVPFKSGDLIAGRYEVRDTVGEGPFGIVFKTFDQELESEVAVKVLHERCVSGQEGQERFETAVRQARRLSQPNIVRLHDSGQDRDRAFVAMQLLEGLNLRKVMGLRQEKEEPFGLEEIVPLLKQIDKALEYCHRSGFHGDLKPENIILQHERLKITDFFIHDALGAEAFHKASSQSVYMAPERKLDANDAGPAADVYAVAVITAELLRGKPFGDDPLDAPTTHNPALPALVDQIIERATAQDPAERFESVGGFVEALVDIERAPVLEVGEDDLLPNDTAIYRLDDEPPSSPSADFNPLDIPTPMDIGEGPGGGGQPVLSQRRENTIVLNAAEDLEILEEEDVEDDGMATTAMPSLVRDGVPPAPLPEPSSLMDEDDLTTTEQPRDSVVSGGMPAIVPPSAPAPPIESAPESADEPDLEPEQPVSIPAIQPQPAISPAPSSDGPDLDDILNSLPEKKKKKKSFMKPVDKNAPAPEVSTADNSHNTARVRTLPKTKARGESVTEARGTRVTVILAVVSIFLLIGVVAFIFYSQHKIQRSSHTVDNFGNGVPTSANK